jgi:hypothetical protein
VFVIEFTRRYWPGDACGKISERNGPCWPLLLRDLEARLMEPGNTGATREETMDHGREGGRRTRDIAL